MNSSGAGEWLQSVIGRSSDAFGVGFLDRRRDEGEGAGGASSGGGGAPNQEPPPPEQSAPSHSMVSPGPLKVPTV